MKKLFKSLSRKRTTEKSIPLPVTIHDCDLLYQMGYEIEINNGSISKITYRGKKQ